VRAVRWTAALLVVLVLLAAAALLVGPAYVASTQSERILAAAGQAFGRDIHADRLGFTVLPAISVRLDGVRIAEDPAFPSDEPFLTARAVELRLALWPLFLRRVVVERVVVDEPAVRLVREPNGRLNADSLGKPPAAPAAADPAAADGAGRAIPAFQIEMVRLRQGTIQYADRATGRSFELADVALDARQPSFGAPIPTSLRARLTGGDLRLDSIVGEGTLDLGDGKHPAFRGTVDAGPGTAGTLAIAKLHARVDAQPPTLTLDDARLELLGGAVTGSARIVGAGQGAGITARFAGDGLDLAALPAPKDRPHPGGKLHIDGDIAGPPPGSPGFQGALTGRGHFAVTDGRLIGIPLGSTLRDVLGPVLGDDRSTKLRDRYPELFGGDELRFTRLGGSGVLGGGRIRSDDLIIAAPSYEARGAGSLGLDSTVDATLTLSASPALTDDILGHSQARAVLVDASGRLTVPLRVRGPLQHPHVTPDPAFATNVARSLLGGTDLEQAAGSLLNRLFGGKKRK
jgi:hypothetical protein